MFCYYFIFSAVAVFCCLPLSLSSLYVLYRLFPSELCWEEQQRRTSRCLMAGDTQKVKWFLLSRSLVSPTRLFCRIMERLLFSFSSFKPKTKRSLLLLLLKRFFIFLLLLLPAPERRSRATKWEINESWAKK